MIYIERKIIIKNNEATIEEPIVLYKGDRNIELQFTIENNPFKYKPGMDITYGQLIIETPNAGPIFSEPAKMSSSRVLFIVTEEMIDGLDPEGNPVDETGAYNFQIRLLNTDQTSRGSLPPVTGGIVIKDPLYEEPIVNVTYVNNRRAVIMRASEPDDVFDEEGNYNRSNWNSGDIITDTKLNKIEEALYQINDDIPTDYATQEYVDDSITNTRNHIENNYATLSYVNNELYRAEIRAETYTDNAVGRINLDNYATTSYVDDQRRATEAYAESFTNNAINKLDLSSYATESFVTDSINSNNNYIETVILRDYVTDQELEDAISGIEGGGGNVDLTGYATEQYVNEYVANNKPNLDGFATEDYVTQALTNYPTHKEMKSAVADMVTTSMPDIMEIRNSYLDNYFTEDDYKNGLCKAVLFSDVVFGGSIHHRGELARMTLGWDKATSTRTITIDSILGYTETYLVQADESLIIESRKTFATDDTINSILGKRNYATQDYVNEMLGDIESLLGGI